MPQYDANLLDYEVGNGSGRLSNTRGLIIVKFEAFQVVVLALFITLDFGDSR
jgi:hypothetical protein